MAKNETIKDLEIVVADEEISTTETSESILARLDMGAEHSERIDGVVVGKLVGFDSTGAPRVDFQPNPSQSPVSTRSTVPLTREDAGNEVALLFEQGDPRKPMIIGLMWSPDAKPNPLNIRADSKRVEIKAEHEIVLRCGEASLTLTKAGKIVLRGKYVLSRSSGVNRIKGGSVQIN